jgi:hypothetical protein
MNHHKAQRLPFQQRKWKREKKIIIINVVQHCLTIKNFKMLNKMLTVLIHCVATNRKKKERRKKEAYEFALKIGGFCESIHLSLQTLTSNCCKQLQKIVGIGHHLTLGVGLVDVHLIEYRLLAFRSARYLRLLAFIVARNRSCN